MTTKEYNELFSVPMKKEITLTFDNGLIIDNSGIISESMTLEESLCSDENPRFGSCESSCFKIRIVNNGDELVNQWFTATMKIYYHKDGKLLIQDGNNLKLEDDGDIKMSYLVSDTITLGKFKVFSSRPSNDRQWRDLVCYDIMHDILEVDMTDWYRTLYVTPPVPMHYPLDALRASFFNYLNDVLDWNVYQKPTDLVNDDVVIYGGFITDGVLLAKDFLFALCEMNGVFGHITADGLFEYIQLTNTTPGMQLKLKHYVDGTGSYEDYTTEAITGICAKTADDDVGVSVGTTDNVYQIQDNLLSYGIPDDEDYEDMLDNLLSVISIPVYDPLTVQTYGNPMLPLGEQIRFDTRDASLHTYVFRKVMTGIQDLRDTITATGKKYQPTDVNSFQTQTARTRGITHKIVNEVSELSSEIYDEDKGILTKLEQTNKEIVLKVQSNGSLALVELGADASTGQTSFVVKAGNFEVDAQGNVTIAGNLTSNNALLFDYHEEGSIPFEFVTTEGVGTIGNPYHVSIKNEDGREVMAINDDETVQQGLNRAYLEIPFVGIGSTLFTGDTYMPASNHEIDYGDFISNYGYFRCIHHDIDISSAPSAFAYRTSMREEDANGNLIGFMGCSQDTNNVINQRFAACRDINGTRAYNRLELEIDDTGGLNVIVDAPTEWRTAIGAAPASSIAYKENINPMTDEEARKILDVSIYSFDYKEECGGEKNQFGVIAEEAVKQIPFAVNMAKSEHGKTSVDYWKFVPHLIKTVQLQEDKIKSLEERISKLENIIEKFAIDTIIQNSINTDGPAK